MIYVRGVIDRQADRQTKDRRTIRWRDKRYPITRISYNQTIHLTGVIRMSSETLKLMSYINYQLK